MASVDYSKVPIKEKPLYMPPLEEVVDVLSRGLADTFESVSVSAVECPDLTQEPYNLTSPGLSGAACLVELGGPPYLVPVVRRDKVYDLAALARHLRRDPAFIAGAGAGPWPYLGVNCEGIINMSVREGEVRQGTRVVSVEPRGAARGAGGYLQQTLPHSEPRGAARGAGGYLQQTLPHSEPRGAARGAGGYLQQTLPHSEPRGAARGAGGYLQQTLPHSEPRGAARGAGGYLQQTLPHSEPRGAARGAGGYLQQTLPHSEPRGAARGAGGYLQQTLPHSEPRGAARGAGGYLQQTLPHSEPRGAARGAGGYLQQTLPHSEPRGAARGAGGYLQQTLPHSETRTALLGNYLLSEGKPGKVIKIVAKKRTGPSNFITAIRETLKNYYRDQVVGLGGTFVLRAGRVRFHVMPEFSARPLRCDSDVDAWLHYFEMRAPIVHLGTLVTGDLGLDLRVQHFHGFSAHGDGGHYHYDTTPAAAEYEAYFTLAAAVTRVDQPADTHHIGRD